MRPVDQDRFFEDGIQSGNCQQAAVASILELPLDEVPNFAEAEHFWAEWAAWLDSRGLADVLVPNRRTPPPGVHYLCYGWSPRGVRHAVVYASGRLAHDPHPSRAGIGEADEQHLVVPVAEADAWRHWAATGRGFPAPRAVPRGAFVRCPGCDRPADCAARGECGRARHGGRP